MRCAAAALLLAAAGACFAGEFDDMCALGDTRGVLEALNAGAQVIFPDERGMTPLHYTVRAGVKLPLSAHLDIAAMLTDAGADVNMPDGDGMTPLMTSLIKGEGFTDMTVLLLERGADPNITAGGMTPLNTAARYGSPGQVRSLLEHGAHVNMTDAEGRGALMSAMLTDSPSAAKVRLLLDAGADVNAQCALGADDGVTPLMAAAVTASAEIVELLIDRGALMSMRSASGLSAFDYASEAGRDEIAFMLR